MGCRESISVIFRKTDFLTLETVSSGLTKGVIIMSMLLDKSRLKNVWSRQPTGVC